MLFRAESAMSIDARNALLTSNSDDIAQNNISTIGIDLNSHQSHRRQYSNAFFQKVCLSLSCLFLMFDSLSLVSLK
jgi:fatty-acid desaturase